ncbi:MAG: Hsp70 family protein, partial [Candidatus Omnitrophica bacterium]|nr:Hsp70 family protein [Candidatus Omnitrophota bacterium]
SIRITAPHKLSEDEINKMVKEAEKYAGEDTKRKETAELKNQADTLVYSTEKALKEHGDKIPEEDKKTIETKLAALRDLLKAASADNEAIKKATEELTNASHKLAEQIYKASNQQQQQGQQASGPEGPAGSQEAASEEKPKDPEVVDAEYKEEDNK